MKFTIWNFPKGWKKILKKDYFWIDAKNYQHWDQENLAKDPMNVDVENIVVLKEYANKQNVAYTTKLFVNLILDLMPSKWYNT